MECKNYIACGYKGGEFFSSDFIDVELSEDQKYKKAIISIPLITAGKNKKNIIWRREILRELAPMFRGVVFKYDINGTQGSSHIPQHLFSPFYDVGWTYDDVTGAWFDGNTIWVKGEVTNPVVIEKLSRIGANGRRELNAGSSGVFLDYKYVACSICGKMPFGTCKHIRGQEYDGKICSIVPISPKAVTRALHVALTNDPADGEAIIKDVLLQEMNAKDNISNKIEDDKKLEDNKKAGDVKMPENNEKDEKLKPDEKKDDGEEKKEEPETADNNNPDSAAKKPGNGNGNGKKTIKCPKCGYTWTVESAEIPVEGIPAPAPKPAENVESKKDSAPKVENTSDDTTEQNRSVIKQPEKTETADYSGKYKNRLIESINSESKRLHRKAIETADMSIEQLETVERVLKSTPSPKVEFDGQDLNGYGAPAANEERVEIADMTPEERTEKFGEFGRWDVIFNPQRYM